MIVLAIDTAGVGCYVALYDSEADRVLGTAGADIGRGHAERLMEFVDEALGAAGVVLAEVGRIAVTVGPGSFTGIRVGVAAARGLALALSVPAVGVGTLPAIAYDRQAGRPLFVVMDAKRNEVYCQTFAADGSAASLPELLTIEAARLRASAFEGDIVGSAAPLVRDDVEAGSDSVSIATVARLGVDVEATGPKPLYLRGPDAKPQTGFALKRA